MPDQSEIPNFDTLALEYHRASEAHAAATEALTAARRAEKASEDDLNSAYAALMEAVVSLARRKAGQKEVSNA